MTLLLLSRVKDDGVAIALAFGTQPQNTTAGATMAAFTVEARRPSGAVDTSWTGTVVISASASSGVCGTVSAVAVAGVATFSGVIPYGWAGARTLTATDQAGLLTSATSSSYTLTRLAADFERSNSEYLSYADNAAFEFTTEMFVSAWVKFESLAVVQGAVCKWATSGSNREYALGTTSGSLMEFRVSADGAAEVSAAQAGAYSTGAWYYLEGMFSGSLIGVCGSLASSGSRTTDTTAAFTGPLKRGTTLFRPGRAQPESTTYLDALMANVFLSPTVPTEAQRNALYNGGVLPVFAALPADVQALAKRGGGTDGDLFFALDEASGTRASASGNFVLTDNNTVLSASAA